MKKICFIVFCCITLCACENSKSKASSALSLVPENTEIIIKINSSEGLENGLKNNTLITAIENYPQIEDFKSLLIPVYDINKENSIIAISKDTNDSLAISYIVPFSKENITLDSISGVQKDSAFNSKDDIYKLVVKEKDFYSTVVDSILFISNKLELAKNAQLQKTRAPDIETILNTSSNQKMVSIFIDHKKANFKALQFRDSLLQNLQFSNYTMIDSDISQNTIFVNGITKATDSTKSLINIFKNTIPQENRIASILPNDIDYFKSITYHDYELFQQNQIKHQFQDSIVDNYSMLQNIVEFGNVFKNNQEAILLRSMDVTTALDNMMFKVVSDQYRSVNIYTIENEKPFSTAFSPFLPIISASNFIVIDDFFVFSDEIDFLQTIISNHQNNTVLSESDSYKSIKQDLSDEASILIFRNASELNAIINTNFTDDIKLDISSYNASAIQYIYDINFAHVNAVFKTNKNKRNSNSVTEELNISIDANLAAPPQLLENHTNSQMDIAVQDVNNNLYLISNQGKVFWKKQLDGKILGNINQIDSYKNGRLQLVFNTSNQLYMLDRNGKNVTPFPLKFNDKITQPVSVFDYDKKKKYRLMVTQGKQVLMYDKNGKIVKGFKYKSAQNKITSQPKHYRIGSKDFIVFSQGNNIEILDRVGKSRVKVKENIIFSENDIYLYNNKFTTSNINGELIQVSQTGKVNYKNLQANSEHKITTTSKTLVVLNDNKLTIKSKTIELDFGNYTTPKIFYINDKIYVTVTDLQSKKGYLFDSQAKPIANFPVYANSQLELNNIDKDNSLEVITKGDDNAIIVYKIQ